MSGAVRVNLAMLLAVAYGFGAGRFNPPWLEVILAGMGTGAAYARLLWPMFGIDRKGPRT